MGSQRIVCSFISLIVDNDFYLFIIFLIFETKEKYIINVLTHIHVHVFTMNVYSYRKQCMVIYSLLFLTTQLLTFHAVDEVCLHTMCNVDSVK